MIHVGDVRAILPTLPAESVQCVVTSPPFYQLRDYQVDGQIGLEKTPEEYLAQLVAVFREVRRILRSDGTAWVEIGDSYAAGSMGRNDSGRDIGGRGGNYQGASPGHASRPLAAGYKPKDLMLIPFRLAAALQADGWWLRQVIIWSRPNPMPESVADRCTTSHSYVLLLAKRATYFYDADAVREPHSPNSWNESGSWRGGKHPRPGGAPPGAKNPGTYARSVSEMFDPRGRNRRSVWEIATHAVKEAHFATFPPKLVEPCILAGTSERGCCRKCSAPWVRVVEREPATGGNRFAYARAALPLDGRANTKGSHHLPVPAVQTTGWLPSCTCPDAGEPVPCVVLDPFLGSGTVGAVSERLGRRWIGVELSEAYAELARTRTAQRGLFGWDGAEVAG